MSAKSPLIRLFVMDVDGTLTDGTITYTADGIELKSFHARDGAGIKLLPQVGIVPAIEHLIEDHHTAGGGRVEFTTAGVSGRLAHPLESALFRTVQEALNNARKHSQSDRVRVHLSQDPRHICVEIRDWGVGFDPEKVGDDHLGLRGIRERARLLGGTAQIAATPGGGTRIRVALPSLQHVATAAAR